MPKHKHAAKIALINEDGQILMLRNSSTHDWAAGKLDLPGGVMEDGESPTEAVLRETQEEAGIMLYAKDVSLGYSSTTFFNEINYVLFLYVGHISKNTKVKLNFEHDEYCWLNIPEALKEYEHPAYSKGLQYLVDHNLLHS